MWRASSSRRAGSAPGRTGPWPPRPSTASGCGAGRRRWLHALTGRLAGLGAALEAALGRVAELMAACEQTAARCAALTDAPLRVSVPSSGPDPGRSAAGDRETRPRATRDQQDDVRMQNEAADVLARSGYRVRRLPEVPGRKSPDFEIEGRLFDCYSPRPSTSVDGIRTKLRDKIGDGQAERFVVDLDRSPLEPADLRRRLAVMAPRRLREVLAVKSGVVHRVWP